MNFQGWMLGKFRALGMMKNERERVTNGCAFHFIIIFIIIIFGVQCVL
jgi:hypothetical protein